MKPGKSEHRRRHRLSGARICVIDESLELAGVIRSDPAAETGNGRREPGIDAIFMLEPASTTFNSKSPHPQQAPAREDRNT